MKRRQFVEGLGIGSAVLAAGGVVHAAQNGHQGHRALTGPLASATVSFGAWPVGTVDEPIDRTVTPLAPFAPNVHSLLPQDVTIKVGGAVSFLLAGFHQLAVYQNKQPGDINTSVLLPIPGAPPVVGLIDDPFNRVFRGIDPRLLSPAPPNAPNLLSQDRVEVVGFNRRGTYLVICAVNVHFADGMFGWVRVIA